MVQSFSGTKSMVCTRLEQKGILILLDPETETLLRKRTDTPPELLRYVDRSLIKSTLRI